jgi:hypothetical protein
MYRGLCSITEHSPIEFKGGSRQGKEPLLIELHNRIENSPQKIPRHVPPFPRTF